MQTQRKRKAATSKEDLALDTAIKVLADVKNSTPKEVDEDDVFGNHVAFSLRKVKDARNKEYAKMKMQEILYQAQFGLLFQQNMNYNAQQYHNITAVSPQAVSYENSPVYHNL